MAESFLVMIWNSVFLVMIWSARYPRASACTTAARTTSATLGACGLLIARRHDDRLGLCVAVYIVVYREVMQSMQRGLGARKSLFFG